MLWETGNHPKTQNVPETQPVIQRHFVICTVLLIAALQHSLQDCSLLLEDKMTQVPPLFHHYSLMKGLGLEIGIAGEEEASLAHPFSTTHQTSTNQEARKSTFQGLPQQHPEAVSPSNGTENAALLWNHPGEGRKCREPTGLRMKSLLSADILNMHLFSPGYVNDEQRGAECWNTQGAPRQNLCVCLCLA